MDTKYLIDIVVAGLSGNSPKVETAALTLARSIRVKDPALSERLTSVVSNYLLTSGSALRANGYEPVPVDKDSQLDMVKFIEPDPNAQRPVFSKSIDEKVHSFLTERKSLQLLLSNGIIPSKSLLLLGTPGTGKTMLARYIANSLNKNLLILDLSAALSSLMGKTGENIKRVLNYARKNPCVLLFDEFDAIAKTRSDNSDLGEMKRVVNVLLMELEDWPLGSVFIATSNHPELLDKAIWRRFDRRIEIPDPQKEQRYHILQGEFDSFFAYNNSNSKYLNCIAEITDGYSASDLFQYSNNVKRRVILCQEDFGKALFLEIDSDNLKVNRGKFCKIAKESLGEMITIRELAEITGLSTSGVQHHVKSD